MTPKFLTVKEVAVIFRKHPRTIRNWIIGGKIFKEVRQVKDGYLITDIEVQRVLDTSKVEALQENRVEKEKRYYGGFVRGAVTPDEIRVDIFGKEPLGGATMTSTYLPTNVLPIGEDTSAAQRAFQLTQRKALKLKEVRDDQWKAFIARVVPIER